MHYVVSLKVERVDREEAPAGERGTPKRQATELAHIVVKDKGLSRLLEKTAAHLALIDEEGA
jgi:hypothetical protein